MKWGVKKKIQKLKDNFIKNYPKMPFTSNGTESKTFDFLANIILDKVIEGLNHKESLKIDWYHQSGCDFSVDDIYFSGQNYVTISGSLSDIFANLDVKNLNISVTSFEAIFKRLTSTFEQNRIKITIGRRNIVTLSRAMKYDAIAIKYEEYKLEKLYG